LRTKNWLEDDPSLSEHIDIDNVPSSSQEALCKILGVDDKNITKRRIKGFKFVIPKWLVLTFKLYISQISPNVPKISHFILNWNSRSKHHVQNMKVNNVGNMAPDLVERLGKKDTKRFTVKLFCRSATTQLIEAGISIVSLCEASNWKSISTTHEYTEYSTITTEVYMNMLDGKKRANDELDNTPT